MSLVNYLALRRARKSNPSTNLTRTESRKSFRRPPRKPFNPLASVQLLADVETALLLLYNAFLFAGFYDLTASLPSLYAEIYHFSSLQIGLCYLSFGVGCSCAALSNGQLLDRNFRRWARQLNVEIKKGRQTDLKNFPIEKVRLQIAFPMLYTSCVLMLIYGWILEINGPLAAALVVLFFFSFCVTVAFNVTSTLLIDFYPKAPATATASNNLLRCLLGAGATGVITPMIDAMGRGWCFTFLSLFLVASSPMLWLIYFRGMEWREKRRLRTEKRDAENEKKRAGKEEEGNSGSDSGGNGKEATVPPTEGGEAEVQAGREERQK
jgi:predicted MFS family arabinose efflux permease